VIELLLQAERAMSVGLTDRAEALYRQVSEADPQNSIAVVGLARVALERGDEPGALALARRALSIDPENAAAARMTERLEEVLRYRGADAAPPAVNAATVAEPGQAVVPAATVAEPGQAVVPAAIEPAVQPVPTIAAGSAGATLVQPAPVEATPATPPEPTIAVPEPTLAASQPTRPPVPTASPAPKRLSLLDRLFRRRGR
jgi:hypothetical protein